jgi:hypothetical protein
MQRVETTSSLYADELSKYMIVNPMPLDVENFVKAKWKESAHTIMTTPTFIGITAESLKTDSNAALLRVLLWVHATDSNRLDMCP